MPPLGPLRKNNRVSHVLGLTHTYTETAILARSGRDFAIYYFRTAIFGLLLETLHQIIPINSRCARIIPNLPGCCRFSTEVPSHHERLHEISPSIDSRT